MTGKYPGVTGHSYMTCNASQRFLVPMERLRRCVIEAMTDMNITGVIEKETKDGIELCGKVYDSRGIIVHLRQHEDCVVMSIWIGLAGDEPLAKVLIDRTSVRIALQPRFPVLPGHELDPTMNPNFARDALPDSATHMGQDVAGYRGMPLR
jgi:hypothetical protein